MEQKLLTEKDAARFICMSMAFLRKSRIEGDRAGRTPGPPWIKLGRSVRYRLEDLDRWIEQNLVTR